MKSSVYISAEQIQVIGYTKRGVQRVATFPLPEGTMFNGNIMDSPFLSECLADMKREHGALFKGAVSLVVDGSSILTRKLATPRLRHKQYLQRVRDDFVDSIQDKADMVAAYTKVNPNTLLGCAVGKGQVDNYISTFKAAGITLTSIHVGIELLHNLVRANAALQQSTIVLNVLDGNTMLSAMFVKGENAMMQRTRLYGEEKEEIFRQAVENLQNLNQFAQSQRIEEISQSYYLGVNAADIDILQRHSPNDNIAITPLLLQSDHHDLPPETHFAYLNMKYAHGGIDLIAARRALDAFVKSQRPKRLWIPLTALYAIAMLGAGGFLFWQVHQATQNANSIEAYINDPARVALIAELDTLNREANEVLRISNQFNARLDWEATMPAASRTVLNQVIFDHGVDVRIRTLEFNEVSGVVRVSAQTHTAQIANDYVRALYDIGVAHNVIFTGYNMSGGVYTFSVDIYLYLERGDGYAD